MASDSAERVKDWRGAAMAYLAVWTLLVLPPLAIFALGGGMFGRRPHQLPGDIIRKALETDLLAIWVLAGSLPVVLVPYWLWIEIKEGLKAA